MAALGHAVGRHVVAGMHTEHGREVDDRGVAAGAQLRRQGPRDAKLAGDVDIEHLLPARVAERLERGAVDHARAIDQAAQRHAQLGAGRGEARGQRRVDYVTRHAAHRGRAGRQQAGRQRFDGGEVEIGEDEMPSRRRERLGGGAPDAAIGAGDERATR